MKCRECIHYMVIDETKGSCFGTEIEGDAEPKFYKKCAGKYFKPKYVSTKEDKK